MASHTSSETSTASGRIGTRSHRPPRDPLLAAADCNAGPERGELGDIIVAAEDEVLAGQRVRQLSRRAEGGIVAIEADQPMPPKVVERAGLAEAAAIVAMSVETDARYADPPRDEAVL